jgi:hypothetical protein
VVEHLEGTNGSSTTTKTTERIKLNAPVRQGKHTFIPM